MKKLLALLLTLLMVFTLVACGENEQTPSGSDSTLESQQQEQTDPDTSEQDKTPEGRKWIFHPWQNAFAP